MYIYICVCVRVCVKPFLFKEAYLGWLSLEPPIWGGALHYQHLANGPNKLSTFKNWVDIQTGHVIGLLIRLI